MKNKILFFVIILLSVLQIKSQIVVDNDPTFSSGIGADAEILKTLILPNGQIIVYGPFNNYNNLPRKNFARLNSNGSLDLSFNCGTSFNQLNQHRINCITYQSDGKLLIGGQFTLFNGVSCKNIVRLNIDGSVDLTFNTTIVFNNEIEVIKVQSNDKLIVGGYFSSFGNDSCKNLARLTINGFFDNTFQIGTGFLNTSTYGTAIHDLVITTNDSIYAAGFFYYYKGKIIKNIIKLDANGIMDTTFINGTGFNNHVFKLLLQTDKKLFCYGDFNSFNNTTVAPGVRLNRNGTLDTSFTFSSLYLYSLTFMDIRVKNNNEYIFSSAIYPSFFTNRLCKLAQTGQLDSLNFRTGIGFGTYTVNTIAIQSDGKIIVAGNFLSYRGSTYNKITRLQEISTVGLKNEYKDSNFIKLFPNPASTELTVTTDLVDGAKLFIFNLVGQIILERDLNALTKVDVSDFKNGTYIYKIVKDGKIIKTDKLIISK